uniref:Uncharacterized protein n=1 Tax=Meloidogyne enterolobii TaxID=390850 RepID=A0A6V7XKJ8_MELEN|nr:unnamed protein product [Meloidogyne enterolobii]
MRERPEFDHFIYTRMMGGGLGNQMYRFAGLYTMGKMLNRTPVYVHEEFKMHEIDKELAYVFPNYHSKVYFLISINFTLLNIAVIIMILKYCWSKNKGRGLYLTGGPNFLDTRYIEHMRPQILKIFEFGKELVSKVTAIKDKIISEDTSSHKMCIHTRVGDFKGIGESQTVEVNKAHVRILKILKRLLKDKTYSLLLFGTDKDFLKTIKVDESISKVHYIINLNLTRGEELNFATQICDSFLITAAMSTYATWMGYLMPDDRPIFFIRRLMQNPTIDTLYMLPESWIPIDENWLKD